MDSDDISASPKDCVPARECGSVAERRPQYELFEKIGEGGMGVVYRAEHEMLRRPTAIKLLAPHAAGEQNLKRFEREAQMTARLTSPHTVSVYDFGRTPEGAFYYVMEYLDGIDLERLVREGGPVPPGRVVHVLLQVCEALAEAHGVGLVHRDIKPANILLSEVGGISDFAKVVDFGLVKDVTGSDVRLTREDVFAGTPQYLAPETIAVPPSGKCEGVERSPRRLRRRRGLAPRASAEVVAGKKDGVSVFSGVIRFGRVRRSRDKQGVSE